MAPKKKTTSTPNDQIQRISKKLIELVNEEAKMVRDAQSPFVLNFIEIENLKEFAKNHKKCETIHPTQFSVNSSTNGIGYVLTATCLSCKTTANITDYDCW